MRLQRQLKINNYRRESWFAPDVLKKTNRSHCDYCGFDFATNMVAFLTLLPQDSCLFESAWKTKYPDECFAGANATTETDPKKQYIFARTYLGELGIRTMWQNTPERYLQAAYWFDKAANQNHIDAQYRLADILERGLAGIVDLPEAVYWYEMAANNGCAKAIERLVAIYETGELENPAKYLAWKEKLPIRPPKQQFNIVDGYNMIFAWDDLAKTAQSDLEAARRQLCDQLSCFAGYKKCRIVLVFDGYKRKGNPGEKSQYHNIQVVYTKENETGDSYIESLVSHIGTNYNVRVATSDSLVLLRSDVLRMSAQELKEEIEAAKKEMRKHY